MDIAIVGVYQARLIAVLHQAPVLAKPDYSELSVLDIDCVSTPTND